MKTLILLLLLGTTTLSITACDTASIVPAQNQGSINGIASARK